MSRDGTKLVYVANRRLYLRPMTGFDSRVIPGSELPDGVQSPVFSPDGEWIAFRSVGDATIKRLPVTGGVPVTICAQQTPFGLNWSERESCSVNSARAFCESRRKAARLK